MNKKIKVLTISDHPLAPSGVGTQTRYVCEALLKSGKFSIYSIGGAIKHEDYKPKRVEEYGDDWHILPVDGFGTQAQLRSIIRTQKPDILWFMTDPRFFPWLWDMENEVRGLIPMVYYHVWDNYPAPMFNRDFYLSNDKIVGISKLTTDIVAEVAPEVEREYLPHAVNPEIFRPLSIEEKQDIRNRSLNEKDRNKVIFFWNNRNARRKQSGSLIFWFKDFLDKYNLHDKAQLLMHTDPKDSHGQDLIQIIDHLGLNRNHQVLISSAKVSQQQLAAMYNMCDCTVNISDAEGFGLSTLESLSCGVPIIANMTGGLQEQVLAPFGNCGIPLFPSSKAIIGSQNVPYIYEDRLDKDQVISALHKMYALGEEGRRELSQNGLKHIQENYNFQNFQNRWVSLMLDVYERNGSWNTRTNYNGIRFLEVA